VSGTGTKKHLTELPTIHPQATVSDCDLGIWTDVGAGTVMKDVQMGDYSYISTCTNVSFPNDQKHWLRSSVLKIAIAPRANLVRSWMIPVLIRANS
jgi:hypothetical protein